MRRLNVWLETAPTPIGTLVATDYNVLDFAYTDDWLAAPANHPLSLSMPIGPDPFGDVLTRAFFGNLLQENAQLDQLIEREGLTRSDIVGILAHVGADCAGAVSVLPEDHPPIKRPGDLAADYDVLPDEEFRDIVARLAAGKSMPGERRDPSPLAGVRRKISLAALANGGFGLPRRGSGSPTTHILKIPDPDHRHEARDEAFCTRLANDCGLPVGTCVDTDVDGQAILLIERFDRHVDGVEVRRLHQEDFAQASGLPPELKYERRAGGDRRFDAAAIGRILTATDRPALSHALFLRMTFFNLLIGNNDNHAKNHGLLHRPGHSPQLSPFYDIVPVQTVSGFTDELAFNIGAAKVPEAITADDLEHFAFAIGLPPTGARALLATAARDIISAIEAQAEKFPREMGAIDRQIGAAADHFNEILGLGLALRGRDAPITSGGGWRMS